MSYLSLVIVTIVIGFATQTYINSSFKKYSRRENTAGITGAQAARRMLNDNGLHDVEIRRVSGDLTDHYDPKTRTVSLSDSVYGERSVSALAVACHECGHAVQHARGYVPLRLRTALVPVANFGSSAWIILLMVGIFLNIMELYLLAILLYSFAVLFQVVTLPVEFNASARALAYINGGAFGGKNKGASTVLRAAALTYVAAALTSILQLLYYLSVFSRD